MNLLVDTHLLLWAAGIPEKLSEEARTLLDNLDNQLIFSWLSSIHERNGYFSCLPIFIKLN